MSLTLKISHISNLSSDVFNTTVEPRIQCRAGQASVCFRRSPAFVSARIHWSSELSSRRSRARCVGSDVVTREISGRSKDETFRDIEPELDGGDGGGGGDDGGINGGNGGGGDGGGEGGGDGEEDEAEEKEFGPILKFDEVMKETERRRITLPGDMLETAKSENCFFFVISILQGSVSPLGFLMRTCTMLRNRIFADPSFLLIFGTEIAIDSCCATFAEVQKRGEDFWSEFELYDADLLVGLEDWSRTYIRVFLAGEP